MKISIGISGAGAFADFSLSAFNEIPDITVAGVFDVNDARSEALAEKFAAKVYSSFAEMLKEDKINLIYIATPPHLHYEQSKQALLAGKNVICEKPAALVPEHAKEVYQYAAKNDLLYVVNLMQRYNPLYSRVQEVIEEKILGEFLHGYFENYASDENLGPQHWMWDHKISGGKFIEHAVHFFDMFEGWLGEGRHISSFKLKRSGYEKDYFSRVQSVGLYRNALVNMYHGFDQPGRMDRQELRLVFERGDITLYEWVPVRMKLHAIVSDSEIKRIGEIFTGSNIEIIEEYNNRSKVCKGNFKEYRVDKKISMDYGQSEKKAGIYKLILKAMMIDQIKWINDQKHKRIITGQNGVNSLNMAWEAEQKAQIIR